MIFALKSTFSIKKLRPKVTEIFTNLHKQFCEYPPCLESEHLQRQHQSKYRSS
jgi:hypothetical protein